MGYLGLEPRTYRLKAEYSTIELVTLRARQLVLMSFEALYNCLNRLLNFNNKLFVLFFQVNSEKNHHSLQQQFSNFCFTNFSFDSFV